MNNKQPEQAFRDYIPEGEDPGAFGNGSFQDFVPTPVKTVEEKIEEAKPKKSKSK